MEHQHASHDHAQRSTSFPMESNDHEKVASVAVMGIEQIDFMWYLKRLAGWH